MIVVPLQGRHIGPYRHPARKRHARTPAENVIIPAATRRVLKCHCQRPGPEGILRPMTGWPRGNAHGAASGATLAAGQFGSAAAPTDHPHQLGKLNEGNRMTLNVDRAEVAKFEALASRWWDRESEFKPLHEINPLRTNWIDDKASLAGKEVLDVGCGGGILTEAMAQRGANVTGIDMGEAPLAVARLHQLESGVQVDYQQCTAEEMAELHPGRLDVCTCS